MGDEIQKFVDLPGGFPYYPGLGFRNGMCSYSTPGLAVQINRDVACGSSDVGYQPFRGCPDPAGVTSQLRPLSRRRIAITAVPGNAILVRLLRPTDTGVEF